MYDARRVNVNYDLHHTIPRVLGLSLRLYSVQFCTRKVNLFAWSQRSAKAVFLYAIFTFELNMQKKIYNIKTSS